MTHHNSGLDALVIAGIAIVLAIVLLDLLGVRRSHRVEPRPRRTVPRNVLVLLTPIYRHDGERDAWILRVIGPRYGPVLRPRGYRSAPLPGRTAAKAPDPPPLVLRRRPDR